MNERIALVDGALERWIPGESVEPSTIHRAMRYSTFAGGKRVRPLLALAAAEAIRDDNPGIEDAACTLEMIHTYSLIHDDLPDMDNDDYRRGRLTCHKVFGPAMAILAGDALCTLAFQALATQPHAAPETRVRLIAELACAAGTLGGMIAGQVRDIEGEGQAPSAAALDAIHRAKTGALLRASVRVGAIYAGGSAAQLEDITRFGEHIGLAFQIIDDVLDVEESSETLGKTAGKDAAQHKITFPAVHGLEASKAMAQRELDQALAAIEGFGGRGGELRRLAQLIVFRKA
jgi:geranylgeranyl diphosphate synthase type II